MRFVAVIRSVISSVLKVYVGRTGISEQHLDRPGGRCSRESAMMDPGCRLERLNGRTFRGTPYQFEWPLSPVVCQSLTRVEKGNVWVSRRRSDQRNFYVFAFAIVRARGCCSDHDSYRQTLNSDCASFNDCRTIFAQDKFRRGLRECGEPVDS